MTLDEFMEMSSSAAFAGTIAASLSLWVPAASSGSSTPMGSEVQYPVGATSGEWANAKLEPDSKP